jgi:hypothetical protein
MLFPLLTIAISEFVTNSGDATALLWRSSYIEPKMAQMVVGVLSHLWPFLYMFSYAFLSFLFLDKDRLFQRAAVATLFSK